MSTLGHHRFCCSVERHLFRSGLALAVYQKLYGLTSKKGWVFHTSKEGLQHFFGVSKNGLGNAFKLLVKLGWLEELDANPETLYEIRKQEFRPKNYRVIPHKEWVLTHPDQCLDETMPWDGEEKDRLGSDLWNVSKGNLKWFGGQLKAVRRSGFSDDEIVARFGTFVDDLKRGNDASGKYKQKGYINWEAARWAFVKWMMGLRKQRAGTPAPAQRVAA
jgi:hypothetical protein